MNLTNQQIITIAILIFLASMIIDDGSTYFIFSKFQPHIDYYIYNQSGDYLGKAYYYDQNTAMNNLLKDKGPQGILSLDYFKYLIPNYFQGFFWIFISAIPTAFFIPGEWKRRIALVILFSLVTISFFKIGAGITNFHTYYQLSHLTHVPIK